MKLVQQHALTSRLLGVDFVPVYRTSADAPAEAEPASANALFSPQGPRSETTGEATDSGDKRVAAQARLDEIKARYIADAPHTGFNTRFKNIVFGEGNPCARLMFIGEAPGADEDATGRPFVGKAGQLLDKMILAMGLKREEVYIANVLKTRPVDNATPTLEETAKCAPYLYDQIAAIMPEVIVTLGLPATRTILNTQASMGSLRSIWGTFRHPDAIRYPDVVVPVMPTYHPAFLLRDYTPENRAKVWADLRKALDKLGLQPPAARG